MAAENWSQPISKTFEQTVYFSTSVAGYKTNKKSKFRILMHIFYFLFNFLNVLLNIVTNKNKNWKWLKVTLNTSKT